MPNMTPSTTEATIRGVDLLLYPDGTYKLVWSHVGEDLPSGTTIVHYNMICRGELGYILGSTQPIKLPE